MHRLTLFAATATLAVGCAAPEFRIGVKNGIPPVSGSVEVQLDTFTCGQPIPAGDYQVTTKKITGGCELSFDKDVEIVRASDYSKLPELMGASNLLQAVDVTIKTLKFTDTGVSPAVELDAQTRVTSATFALNKQVVIADKSVLKSLPKTVSITGEALKSLKSQIDRRVPAVAHATAVVVLPDMPALPKKMKVDYDAEPTLVLGPGEIQFPTK